MVWEGEALAKTLFPATSGSDGAGYSGSTVEPSKYVPGP
jgi:hypothetical protein